MYESQVLNAKYLDSLNFADPWPEQTLITELPGIVKYYLQRWEGLGLLDSREKHVPQRLLKPAETEGNLSNSSIRVLLRHMNL